MADSQVMQKIEELSKQREEIREREGTHHAGADDRRKGEDIDHALGVLWDLRRREMSGEIIDLDEDFLDRYSVTPGDDPPEDQ